MHSFWPITGVRISGVGDVELVAQACEPFGSVEPSEARRTVVAEIFGFSGAAGVRERVRERVHVARRERDPSNTVIAGIADEKTSAGRIDGDAVRSTQLGLTGGATIASESRTPRARDGGNVPRGSVYPTRH